MTITDFLLARIAEDEHCAQMVAYMHDLDGDSWERSGWTHTLGEVDRTRWENVSVGDRVIAFTWARCTTRLQSWVATHIARHDPARVLAECEAKRRIVEEHRLDQYGDRIACSPCGFWPSADGGCPTLRLLALPYASHPDYDEAWRL